ncbi:capsular polysaccharide biosynthesis protein [Burkholderia gladioli]|uniref:capsular polysaccharide biosynthesis protein n=1 Tax=Burkholderia gladioli TaxID=28095 RepID=UPI0015E71C1C|nr:capsular biosynthesis protein [Burkholderia gladioli]MBA1360619.1 capsular biosynthesis protein [Burkholderia gladioli]
MGISHPLHAARHDADRQHFIAASSGDRVPANGLPYGQASDSNSCVGVHRARLRGDGSCLYAGPICGHRDGLPPLSWFRLQAADPASVALVRQLQTLFRTAAAHHEEKLPGLRAMMQRVVASDALHVYRQFNALPAKWHEPAERARILLIDEREKTRVDFCTSSHHRHEGFRQLIATASEQDAELWVLRSADAGTGKWLSERYSLPKGATVLGTAHSLHELLRTTRIVYVLGASEGMAALLANAEVHVFGSPYYAGWGLTEDHATMPERHARPTLESLFEAVFLGAASYLDPQSHHPGSLDAVLDCIELQHSIARRFSDLSSVAGVAFQWWKRPFATPFVTAGGGRLRWVANPEKLRKGEIAAIWGGRSSAGLAQSSNFFRIEDGFLHSCGLGSDMFAPHSQVIDRRGIYFDASRANDLTAILNETIFSPQEMERAALLRKDIIKHGLTKYNLGRRPPQWRAPSGKRVVLVPGQVADDASIRLGTRGVASSEALLREVRRNRPDAFIVYKPHPDVLSGNRQGLVDADQIADVVDTTSDLISLIDNSDELHTLSSLSGFDALIRGKQVHTYGLPFYAGWGLTQDALPQPWRERRLTLDALVAGVMLRYPLYWDWRLGLFTTPEAVVAKLAEPASRPLGRLRGSRTRQFAKILRWCRNVIRHFRWKCKQRDEHD